MTKRIHCPAGARTVLVRNIAARGLLRTFTLHLSVPIDGRVEVRRSVLPLFLAAEQREEPLRDGMTVRRRFFDASFELAVVAGQGVDVTLS